MQKALNAALKRWIAVTVMGLALAVPIVAGIVFACNLEVGHEPEEWVAVATIESLPANGMPQKLSVRVSRWDAWIRLPDEVVGHVFLRRVAATDNVIAFPTSYGRAGCAVEFDVERNVFEVPCLINIGFDADGRKLPSIRDGADLSRVRTMIADGMVYVRPSDLTPDRD